MRAASSMIKEGVQFLPRAFSAHMTIPNRAFFVSNFGCSLKESLETSCLFSSGCGEVGSITQGSLTHDLMMIKKRSTGRRFEASCDQVAVSPSEFIVEKLRMLGARGITTKETRNY